MAADAASGRGRRARSELALRLTTAAVGIPAVVVLILAGGVPFTVAVAVLLAAGAAEMTHAAGLRWSDPLTLLAAATAAACALLADAGAEARWAALAAFVALSLAVEVFRAAVVSGFSRWTATVAGALYAGVLGSHLVLLRLLPDGRAWLLLMVFTTFATDTGAFVTGRTIGGRKLAPHVSPGKTISGAIGGIAWAAVAAVALNAVLALEQHPAGLAALGAGTAIAAEVGDLAESLLKRSLGIKDMGRIFPGHGGVLDRLDSMLFAAPVVYYVARWIS